MGNQGTLFYTALSNPLAGLGSQEKRCGRASLKRQIYFGGAGRGKELSGIHEFYRFNQEDS